MQIVTGLVRMSDIVGGSTKQLPIEHKVFDPFWFAEVADYLFDLNVVVKGVDTPASDASNAQIIIEPDDLPQKDESIDLWPLSKAYPDCTPITGGRVKWETIFRSSFGKTFTGLDPSHIAEFTGCAASLIAATLQHDNTNPQAFFLSHPSTVRGLSGYGLVETVTSWFPELRRMAPQMGKSSRLPFQPARDRCDEISDVLDASCMCDSCGNASPTSKELCKHTMVEVVMSLGLLIARTVVIPNLFPKRAGVLAFYERLHKGRLSYKGKQSPVPEGFMKDLVAALPTPKSMIETMCLIFTGSIPSNIKDNTLSITHEGISVTVTAWNPNSGARDQNNEDRQRAGVNVWAGTLHLHGRVFNHGYWVPAFGDETDLSFKESFELLRTRPKEVKQCVKANMGDLMFSYIRVGDSEIERAQNLGWLVL